MIINNILYFFFPSVCYACRKDLGVEEKGPLCSKCEDSLVEINYPYCVKCGVNLKGGGKLCDICKDKKYYFDFSRSVFMYDDVIGSVIKAYKYSFKEYLSDYLALKMIRKFKSYLEFSDYNAITYVPSSADKIRKRGYDHMHIIAEKVSKETGLFFIEKAIYTRKKFSQVELDSKSRMQNIKGSFFVVKDVFKDKNIIVLDDVATTLSTLNEVSLVIKNAGAKKVCCYTIAREYIKG